VTTISETRIDEIVALLDGYQGDNIWQDVILKLNEYSEEATDQIDQGSNDMFALSDGSTVIAYYSAYPELTGWGPADRTVADYLDARDNS
jgi:hypothetical protein